MHFCNISVILWLLNADNMDDFVNDKEEYLFVEENLLSSEKGEKNEESEVKEYIESKDSFCSEEVL